MSPEMNFDAVEVQETVTDAEIQEWLVVKSELARVKAKESIMRQKIIKALFSAPEEGTNKHELGNGYGLKFTHKLDRQVDDALLTNLLPAFNEKGISVDILVERKPVLKIAAWRKLTDEQALVFNQCITVKPASGTLEFTKPKGQE